jgi:hypothetical protein
LTNEKRQNSLEVEGMTKSKQATLATELYLNEMAIVKILNAKRKKSTSFFVFIVGILLRAQINVIMINDHRICLYSNRSICVK